MYESHKHNVKEKKPDTIEYIEMVHLYNSRTDENDSMVKYYSGYLREITKGGGHRRETSGVLVVLCLPLGGYSNAFAS